MSGTRRPGPVLVLALGATTVASLPVFLVGALAGEIILALDIRESAIGILVACFFTFSALSSTFAGRFVSRLGWLYSLVLTAALVVVAALPLFLLPPSLGLIVVSLVAGGLANGISHPAANLALVRSIDPGRLGIAFGLKQAAIPSATLLSGLALPLLAVPFGWRSAYLALAILCGLILLNGASLVRAVQRAEGSVRGRPEEAYDRTYLGYLVIGAGLGAAACNSLGAFLVLHALDVGVGPAAAGMLLATGSVTNILARLVLGWQADRRLSGHLQRVAMMMLVGAGGVILLAIADGIVMLAFGTLVAFGIGWGYNGLLHHGSMKLYGHAAASVTGKLQATQYVGAVVGPLSVGFVIERVGFLPAWLLVAALLMLGGLLLLRFRMLFRRRSLMTQ